MIHMGYILMVELFFFNFDDYIRIAPAVIQDQNEWRVR